MQMQHNTITSVSLELSNNEFQKVAQTVYRVCGIDLKQGKEALVRARLMKRLRLLEMSSFKEYLQYIESNEGSRELGAMIDVMTTNKTSFFREDDHFNYFSDTILPELNKTRKKRMRFWSAACSSGEEPFSLAIVLEEKLPDLKSRDVRILATDISTNILEKACRAVYDDAALTDLQSASLRKYFVKVGNNPAVYQVKENVRQLVKFAMLNLMDPWPMKGRFDVIFCRNVMIYFDKPTQQKLINRFWDVMEPGGYLFVGHSEGLSAISHKFKYLRPATYRK